MLAYYCCIEILTHNTSKVYKSHHNSTNLHWKSYKNFSEVSEIRIVKIICKLNKF